MVKKLKFKNLFFVIFSAFFFISCASKDAVQEYDKPALYWYNKMAKQISTEYLEQADDTYTSLESEHRNSPLIPTALLILANAHINNEEYALANFYLDEYIKRFAISKNIDYVRYLKIKANFLGFENDLRNQDLILETIKNIATFEKSFPNSLYMPLVNTMNARLHMAKAVLDENISDLYKKLDKQKASKFYNQKAKDSWVNSKEIKPVSKPFYKTIFEKNLF